MHIPKKYHEALPRASKMNENVYPLSPNDFEFMDLDELKMIYLDEEDLWTKEEKKLAEEALIKRLG